MYLARIIAGLADLVIYIWKTIATRNKRQKTEDKIFLKLEEKRQGRPIE